MRDIQTPLIYQAFSKPRLDRYLKCQGFGQQKKALSLYQANLRLSVQLFAVMSIFEVILRNAIDQHYVNKFGKNWLKDEVAPGGFFLKKGCERSRDNLFKAIGVLGDECSNDQIVADMSFGFWRYLFNSKEFAAAGGTLLQIFVNRPKGVSHTEVFNYLSVLNNLRNRIAHHEPICFAGPKISRRGLIPSSAYVKATHSLMLQICFWIGCPLGALFKEIDRVEAEVAQFDHLLKGKYG
ncbi:MAG: hypothetical protein ACKVT2_03815 [Saprospiraceae bacterium]